MSDPEANWADWVGKADNDLLNVRNNLAAERVPWDTVCFHAQQAAEKMLKAFLVRHGQAPRKIHDLLALLEDCLGYDSTLEELRGNCVGLNSFSVDVRYPYPVPDPDEAEAREAVKAAEAVYGAVLRRLPAARCEGEK